MYLSLKNIKLKYQTRYILDSLDLEINKGELVIILGESGCGKTTLLKIIAGILPPEEGQIFIEGEEITSLPAQYRKVGYVPQAQVLFPHMKVKENIEFGLKAQKIPKEQRKEILQWVANLTQIEDLMNRYPTEISGGQKQRVALARAMAVKPRLLLLDEPLSSIDATARESLALTIRRIQKETGTTTLYVTHNQEEARLIADRVAIMYDGKIQQIGKIIEVDNNPRNYLIAKIMGATNVWPVFFYEEKRKNVIVDTPLGSFELPKKKPDKITGIQIPPTQIKITQQEVKDEDMKYITLKGYIKSIIQRDVGKYRAVVELAEKKIEYIKIDIAENYLSGIDIGAQVNILIDSQEVKLL
ncbi:MAG: ABC transporter ATP-binding protein [Candidatus Heimdallarchaeaceae archaeon]